jgi:hypothetical protein
MKRGSVFVSSRMKELRGERIAIRKALAEVDVTAWVYEDSAGAQPVSPEKAYLEAIEASDIFVGVYGTEYGEHTAEEYAAARARGKRRLLYVRNANQDDELEKFLEPLLNVREGLAHDKFDTSEDLATKVRRDVLRWLPDARASRDRRLTLLTSLLSACVIGFLVSLLVRNRDDANEARAQSPGLQVPSVIASLDAGPPIVASSSVASIPPVPPVPALKDAATPRPTKPQCQITFEGAERDWVVCRCKGDPVPVHKMRVVLWNSSEKKLEHARQKGFTCTPPRD